MWQWRCAAGEGPPALRPSACDRHFGSPPLDTFTNAEVLREWEAKTKPDAVKVIYDRAAAEVRVLGTWRGKLFEKLS